MEERARGQAGSVQRVWVPVEDERDSGELHAAPRPARVRGLRGPEAAQGQERVSEPEQGLEEKASPPPPHDNGLRRSWEIEPDRPRPRLSKGRGVRGREQQVELRLRRLELRELRSVRRRRCQRHDRSRVLLFCYNGML